VQPYPGMPVLVIIVSEERAAESAGVLERPELPGKGRAVLQGLVVNTNARGGVMALH
jgi:hypothetical protein